MKEPKCPICGGNATENEDCIWDCEDDDCMTTFCACPVCGEWVCYESSGSKAKWPYELSSCLHLIATFECESWEFIWNNESEKIHFRCWCKKEYPEENEDEEEKNDWWYGDWEHESYSEEELLEKYANTRSDWIAAGLDNTNGRHGSHVRFWFLKQKS